MSHETHTESGSGLTHTRVSFSSGFWLVVILVGLFIGALNFIQSMGGGHHEAAAEGHGHEGAATEQMHEGKKADKPEGFHEEPKEEVKPEHEHTVPEHK